MAAILPSWDWTAAAAALLIGSVIYTFRGWFISLLTPKGVPGIPAYSNPAPLMGDLPRMASSIKEHNSFSIFFDQVGKDLGPIAQVRLSFLKNMVIVNDYQEVVSILNRPQQFDRAIHTAVVFRNIVPTGQIAIQTNDVWKQHRRLIGPAMTSKSLSMMTPGAVKSVKELVALFEAKRVKAAGRPFATAADLVSAAMDVINGMAFGESWSIIKECRDQVLERGAETGPLGEAVFTTQRPDIAESSLYLLDSVPIKSAFPSLACFMQSFSPSWRKEKKKVDDFLRAKIAASRREVLTKGESAVELADNTLDMMVAREMKGDKMPDNEIIDEIFLYLVAGTETSAVTLAWYLKYMTNHPDVQRKLRAHLMEKVPELQDRDMAYEDVDPVKVPYLEAVVQETLRAARVASGFAREARVDTSILGYAIPKGTTVITPASFHYEDEQHATWGGGTATEATAALDGKRFDKNRRVGFWKASSARDFDPERWLAADGNFDANAGPSMPFSNGQRGCYGKNLALLEMRLVIAHLTLAFFFAKPEDKFNSQASYETITRHPEQSFILVEKWETQVGAE